jgi:hypothetical protein
MTAAEDLLERFVDLYGEIPVSGSSIKTARKLWRDYWEYSGEHMIMLDEGWISAIDRGMYTPEEILDEVNAPKEK